MITDAMRLALEGQDFCKRCILDKGELNRYSSEEVTEGFQFSVDYRAGLRFFCASCGEVNRVEGLPRTTLSKVWDRLRSGRYSHNPTDPDPQPFPEPTEPLP